MKILIIEDEARAASQLENLLVACAFDYELLDIIDTIEDSIIWFQQHALPDLVFMDIQLADGLSFEIFQKMELAVPIIFTTAFDQYAIQAFKVNSVDYLLKPIQQDDLKTALDKFMRSNREPSVPSDVLKQLLTSIQIPQERKGILVKEGSGFVQIKISELLYIYSEESITFGVSLNKRFIIEETIEQLYNTLDVQLFYRINRGQIVARKAIGKIEPYFNHRLKLTMEHSRDQEFIVSRPKTSDFKMWMNR